MSKYKIIECPRDALQGRPHFVPTDQKIAYYQQLLKVGFHTLDCGSFVSPKAIPQMADTANVIDQLDLSTTPTKLLVIVANLKGAEMACAVEKVSYLGYPFSVSENFQVRNTRKTIAESKLVLEQIIDLANAHDKKVVVYLSMGFGNPYGDPWSVEIISDWVQQLEDMGVGIISLSDTIGAAQVDDISALYSNLIPAHPEIEFGAHFHTQPNAWYPKIHAAYLAGCKRFDGAIKGWGGCPMAQNELVGNMPTEKLISYLTTHQVLPDLDVLAFESAYNASHSIFI